MFPTVRWPGLVKVHCAFLIVTTALALNLSNIEPTTPNHNAKNNQIKQLQSIEKHLEGKATDVLLRVTNQPFSVDLNVTLDHTRTRTRRFSAASWHESVDDQPRIKAIVCCVTLESHQGLDTDRLYNQLTYSLGLDLSRGDLLKIITL